MPIDPDRTARQLVADLRWGKLSRLDRGTIERVCDSAIRQTGRVTAEHRERLVTDVAYRTFEIWRRRQLAKTG